MLKKSHEIKLRERRRGLPNDPLREIRPFVVVPRDKRTINAPSDTILVSTFNSRISESTPTPKAAEKGITIPIHNVLTNRGQPSRRESFRVRPSLDKQPNGTTLVPQQARVITPVKRSLAETEDNISVHSIQVQRTEQISFTQSTSESTVNPYRTYAESIISTYMDTDIEDNANRERRIPTEYQPLLSSPIKDTTQLSTVETPTSNISIAGSSIARDTPSVRESTGIDVPVEERSEVPTKYVTDEPSADNRVKDVHDTDSPTTNPSILEKTAVEMNNVDKSIVDIPGLKHLTTDIPTDDTTAAKEPVVDTSINEDILDKELSPTAENVDNTENVQIDEDIIMDDMSDNENDKGVEDETTVNKDHIVEKDTAVEEDTAVERDTVIEEATTVEEDTAVERDAVVERDTAVESGDGVKKDTAIEQGDDVEKDAAVEQGDDTQHMMMDVDIDDPIDYNNYDEEEREAAKAQQSTEQNVEDIIDQDELISKMNELELLSTDTKNLKISRNARLHIKALEIICTQTMREMRRSLDDPFARSVIENYYNIVIKSFNSHAQLYDEHIRVSHFLEKLVRTEKKNKEVFFNVDVSRIKTQRKIASAKKECEELTEILKTKSDLDNFFTSVWDIAK